MMVVTALGEIHFLLLFKFRVKLIFYVTFGCISMTVAAALGHREIYFNLLFEFRLMLKFSFTFGSTSILV